MNVWVESFSKSYVSYGCNLRVFWRSLSSPVFSILRDGVMISFAKIEKRCVEKTLGRARVYE